MADEPNSPKKARRWRQSFRKPFGAAAAPGAHVESPRTDLEQGPPAPLRSAGAAARAASFRASRSARRWRAARRASGFARAGGRTVARACARKSAPASSPTASLRRRSQPFLLAQCKLRSPPFPLLRAIYARPVALR